MWVQCKSFSLTLPASTVPSWEKLSWAKAMIDIESVGTYRTPLSNMGNDKSFHRAPIKPLNRFNLSEAWFAIICKPNRHNGLRTPRTSSSSAWIGSPEIRFVHLYYPIQLIEHIPISHSISDFMQHKPRSIIRNIQFFAQLKSRMSTFVFSTKK